MDVVLKFTPSKLNMNFYVLSILWRDSKYPKIRRDRLRKPPWSYMGSHLGACPAALAQVAAPVHNVAASLRGEPLDLLHHVLDVLLVLAGDIPGLLLQVLLGQQHRARVAWTGTLWRIKWLFD